MHLPSRNVAQGKIAWADACFKRYKVSISDQFFLSRHFCQGMGLQRKWILTYDERTEE